MIMGAEQGQRLLDFGQKLDINLLDNVISTMYSGDSNQQKVAQEILTHLKEHPESWTRVDSILEFSSNQQTKYFALQILEHAIKVRWKALPPAQCEGIKKYIVSLIIKISSSQDSMEKEKMYLGKLNIILVQILKKEWPHNWPSFIPEIVGASKTNESLCQNNMIILKLLSEEVFDFSLGQMTQSKIKHLKDQMCKEFMQIFQLCQFVMDNSQNAPLVLVTLETLLKFLSWIPLGYIFETKLITTLIHRFLNVPLFRNTTLKCLTEIAGLKAPQYDEQFVFLYSSTMQQLLAMLPIATNIKDAYASGSDDEQNFIQNLSMFLSTYLKEHGSLIEKNEEMRDILKQGHIYLLLISNVEEIEIFKICLEYWNVLASSLYREKPISTYIFAGTVDMPPRWRLYQEIISELRVTMVSRMARPEEVLVVENDQGEVVREFMKDTDAINLYKNMRETLVYLTHLDYADTERIMLEKLQKQVNRSEWSWKNLNTLCWAIGSISGAMHEEDEKRFLVTVIKDLLYLCEQKRGKDNKAIIASNIMYVVGQYPRFLKAHWKFLKTVVNKLFEFMHETHEGVQDMACDTFIKIAHKCRRHFILIQPGEVQTFVEEILINISSIICDLQPLQVHTFYEAVGMMIASQTNPQMQESLIQKYMLLPNLAWEGIVEEASKNVEILKDPDTIKQLGNILKTNVKACKSLEHPYVSQLAKIYLDMLNLYHVMNSNISQAVGLNGAIVIKQPLVQGMRLIKKETLKLISCWISLSNDPKLVLDNFISPLLEAILVNYKQNLPDVREPEVLVILTTLVNKLGAHVNHYLLPILDAIFESTLSMISSNFEDYPEHRVSFYLFLQAVNVYCSEALLTLPPPQFKLVFDSIIWGIKHTMRNVAEASLDILFTLLKNVEQSKNDTTQLFYQTYFTSILEHLFAVVSDTSLTADLPTQSTILAHMFSLLEQNKIKVPLNPIDPAMSAPDYIKDFTSKLLKNAFPHLSDAQINVTIQGFFNLHHDLPAFKDHLRDFLVQIREFSGADDSDLYIAEKEAAIKKAHQDKLKTIINIPGMIKPSEMSEEMQQ